ncbi:hypothetical protein CVD25_08025 [Bacillus canaveralius]|uniref:UPF0180 protein CU635_17350 n=1 Tax=Bacillus canaveralius TaxID=1403243 RepID=A0A2N5GIJ9_9BACI|nr:MULTISPECIES: YkuS family protein [Bacillus]PLR80814.1 hypothetical protein CU635_17350 [Bacillus canaveralius]PLR81922.1 hypothetical protein CVD23_17615 [Bacillus sp. V33-4]PLR98309.1 hypothetical protein CVD25_08025 [Bacillus canaveralius]RSK52970.1 YkuS family protein [Bacillus canaveralius]
MARIGVEQSLSYVQDALREKGYDVVELRQESDAENCSCCVITGLDTDVMGIEDTVTSGPVIEARGLTAEEVCQRVEERLR